MTLRNKMIGLALVAAALPALVALVLLVDFQTTVSRRAESELRALGKDTLSHIAQDVYGLCEIMDARLQERLNARLAAADKMLAARGGFRPGPGAITWEAVNQFTKQPVTLRLPKLPGFGREAQSGATMAGLFERVNAAGDMLRAGETFGPDRAAGVLVPAVQNGIAEPAIAAVLKGETYRGSSAILGASGAVLCQPLRAGSGEVAGMLCSGESFASMDALRRFVMNFKLGKSGYVGVMHCAGPDRGHYVISQYGKRDGEDIWNARDANGNWIVKELARLSLSNPKGQVFMHSYPWKNQDDLRMQTKVSAVIYYEPWDWMISAGIYEDDYLAPVDSIRSSSRQLMLRLAIGVVLVLLAISGAAVVLSGRITGPLGAMASVAKQIAAGDLGAAGKEIERVAARGARRGGLRDLWSRARETDDLLSAFQSMTAGLASLIGQVQCAGIQVSSSATEIAASARQLEATVTEQASSTNEVNATAKEISATSADLLRAMNGVASAVAGAGTEASASHTHLGAMETAIRELMKGTGFISGKLGIISERAHRISTVVTTINRISDQTSLLSLNAAIEAEKAGEYGRGFSVVAREISRLADQTALSTQDIEAVIREMQSSVSAGVMEMDKFSEEVRRRVEEIGAVGGQIDRIIEQVEALAPQFATVQDGMEAQTQAARQISEAMAQLSQAADQTKQSQHEFRRVAEQLNEALQGMRGEVSRFRTGAE